VDDLVETLWFEDLRDVVLALHSHAGVFPLRCCTDPTVFDETALQAVPRSYVQHTDPPLASLELSVPRATSDGCAVHHVACGHDMMIERPQEVAQLLRAIGHSAPD